MKEGICRYINTVTRHFCNSKAKQILLLYTHTYNNRQTQNFSNRDRGRRVRGESNQRLFVNLLKRKSSKIFILDY